MAVGVIVLAVGGYLLYRCGSERHVAQAVRGKKYAASSTVPPPSAVDPTQSIMEKPQQQRMRSTRGTGGRGTTGATAAAAPAGRRSCHAAARAARWCSRSCRMGLGTARAASRCSRCSRGRG